MSDLLKEKTDGNHKTKNRNTHDLRVAICERNPNIITLLV